jgi:hypothetical protein
MKSSDNPNEEKGCFGDVFEWEASAAAKKSRLFLYNNINIVPKAQ